MRGGSEGAGQMTCATHVGGTRAHVANTFEQNLSTKYNTGTVTIHYEMSKGWLASHEELSIPLPLV
jgi:hypothetical protein